MSLTNDYRKQLIDKFGRLYRGTQGGIFTKVTREKMLTGKGVGEKGLPKNQFWYRQRENVKTALIDFQLFIELAGKKNVDHVLTRETLEPIIISLLLDVSVFNKPPDQNRAEIAEMLVQLGFNYLEMNAGDHINLSNKRALREAVDLSHFLVQSIKGERYSRPSVGLEKE